MSGRSDVFSGTCGLVAVFSNFSLLWSSARFRDLGNQPVFVVRACIRTTQMPISVGFPLCPKCQLFLVCRGPVDEKVIQERFQEFKSSFERRPYQRQKSALEQQLSAFLASVSPPKTISSCTVDDVIKFLIYKDSSGRTVVHVPTCSGGACACPRRLAAGTLDSLLGKLRSIFNKLGRIDHTNPITHPRIKEYLNFVRVEQAGMAVSPSQAVPLFFVKFQNLIAHLRGKIVDSQSLSRSSQYILVMDATFFVIDFFTGDRASDLGRLLVSQVFKLKDREGTCCVLPFVKL